MHSHVPVQEMQLLAAPLIVRSASGQFQDLPQLGSNENQFQQETDTSGTGVGGTVSLDGDVDEVLGSQEFRKAMIGGH